MTDWDDVPLRDEAKAAGCTCLWRADGIIEMADPRCPIIDRHVLPRPKTEKATSE